MQMDFWQKANFENFHLKVLLIFKQKLIEVVKLEGFQEEEEEDGDRIHSMITGREGFTRIIFIDIISPL